MNDEKNNLPPESPEGEDVNALEEGDLIEMVDENGETISFIFVDALEYEGNTYLALADQDEDDAVFFLRIEQDEDGSDVYTAPDEELENRLFEQFQRQREEED